MTRIVRDAASVLRHGTEFGKGLALWTLSRGARLWPAVVVAIVLTLSWSTLRTVQMPAVRAALRTLDPPWVGATCALTALNIVVMGLYDVVAFRRTRSSALERWRYGAVAFAWSNFLTFGPLAGPAIRVWLYGPKVDRVSDVKGAIVATSAAFTAGLAGWTFGVAVAAGTHSGLVATGLIAPFSTWLNLRTVRWLLPRWSTDWKQTVAGSRVTSVVTHAGADDLHIAANSFLPRLLFANGGVHGVEFWEPNAIVSGPLVKGRAYLDQAVSYRYDRNRFETLSGPQEDRFTALLSWTQLDVRVSPRHHVTATISADPQNNDRANVTAFTPADTVPSLAQGRWSAGFADRATIGGASTLELQASTVRTASRVAPNGAGDYAIAHDSVRGSYFDAESLHGRRTELAAVYTSTAAVHHVIAFGFSASRAGLGGSDASRPVDLLRSDGSLDRRITFGPATQVSASTSEIGGFVQDTWTAAPWLTLATGVRYDRTSAAAAPTLTPRLSWTIQPGDRQTSVSGGIGLFADKLPLGALAFPSYPVRSVQRFDATGAPDGRSTDFVNAVNGELRAPRAFRWDIGIEQRYAAGWLTRAKYQERHGRDELIITPEDGVLSLRSAGASIERSLEVTVGWRPPRARHQFYVSYLRSSSQGDLNTFDAIGGVFKEPFIQANAVGPLPMNVPHRLLAWGLFPLPARLTFAPFVELRNGFPYSAIDDDWVYRGARDSYQLPWAASLDVYVNTLVSLPRHLPDARIGLKIYNLVGNVARDVQRDITRSDFGTTYNAPPRDYSFVFELLWGHR